MKVSIVVAIYGIEKYLNKCLLSLANQTYENIEILCINDSTKDNSQDIIDSYLEDLRFKSFIKPNGGLSDCRNYGLNKADGDYICFIDGDDYLDENYIKYLVEKAKSNNADITYCNINNVFKNSVQKINCYKKEVFNIYPSAWNKLFKTAFLKENNLLFKKNLRYEDVNFIYKCLAFSPKIEYVDEYLYYYLQRKNSMVRDSEKILDLLIGLEDIILFYQKNNVYDENKIILEYVFVRYTKMTFLKLNSMHERKKRKELYYYSHNLLKNYFPGYKKNEYLRKNIKIFMYINLINYFTFELIHKKLRKKIILKDLTD